MITKKDIQFVEFMMDRLIDVYGENRNTDYLIHAQRTISKMYKQLEKQTKQ